MKHPWLSEEDYAWLEHLLDEPDFTLDKIITLPLKFHKPAFDVLLKRESFQLIPNDYFNTDEEQGMDYSTALKEVERRLANFGDLDLDYAKKLLCKYSDENRTDNKDHMGFGQSLIADLISSKSPLSL